MLFVLSFQILSLVTVIFQQLLLARAASSSVYFEELWLAVQVVQIECRINDATAAESTTRLAIPRFRD